jgi:hypothetical protein
MFSLYGEILQPSLAAVYNVQCPKCSQNTYIGDIRKDYDIAGFIENLTVNPSDSENQDKLVCELCENPKELIASKCETCSVYMCKHCTKGHQKSKLSIDHRLTPIEDILKKLKSVLSDKTFKRDSVDLGTNDC